MGDVIGDINSRRGRIEGMEDQNGAKHDPRLTYRCLRCSDIPPTCVPRPRAVVAYSMFFDKYEPVPKSVQEKIISKQAEIA